MFDLARRGEKRIPCLLVTFLYKGRLEREAVEKITHLCECGCGLPTPIAKRTRTSRGQVKGAPLRFINGHNSFLLSSEEQRRRASFRDPDALRYSGKRDNYVKLKGRHMHRVVAEQKIGRALLPGEVVHHKDGDKWNNNPDNLEVMTQSEHARIHCLERWRNEEHG